jgi:cyclic pyranopterin phosphate synthase
MGERVIALTDWRRASPALPATRIAATGLPLRDLRISVTDRCNFRCVYCMPKEVFG